MFNIITAAEEITTWYDLTTVLTTMVACTSTFVAIIGGLIANKAISDTAEKESIDSQLQQIDAELTVTEKELDRLNEWKNEFNAKDYIRVKLAALLDRKPLSEVYDSDDSNEVEYNDLLRYWDKALIAVKSFQEDFLLEKNNDGIPKTLVNKFDDFQYSICVDFYNSIKNNSVQYHDTITLPDVQKYRVKLYNDNSDKIDEFKKEYEILKAKKQLLQKRCDALSIGKDIKSGMKIFSVVSIFNIIIPIIFMLCNPTSSKMWYYMESIISIAAFILGICVMILYIFSLFPKKDKETNLKDKKGAEQNNE